MEMSLATSVVLGESSLLFYFHCIIIIAFKINTIRIINSMVNGRRNSHNGIEVAIKGTNFIQ